MMESSKSKKNDRSFEWQSLAGNYDEIRELINILGREKFSVRAGQYDAAASFPFENYKDMREAGILAMTVPRPSGGLGINYAEYATLSAEMGKWCGATALTYNMHFL